jgi:hypothetical protein
MCARLRTDPGRPLVLKNPWDCANFMVVKELVPEARFVFIHRHPERTIHSNINATRNTLASRNSYAALVSKRYRHLFSGSPYPKLFLNASRILMTPRMRIGVRIVTAATARALNYYVTNIERLDKSEYLSIRYEDLIERPSELLKEILDFAGLDPSLAVRPLTPPKPRRTALLPEVEWYRDTIARKTAAYMRMQGYGPGGVVSR